GGFHDAGSAAGTYHKPVRAFAEGFGPARKHGGESAGAFVVFGERAILLNTRGAKKDNRVADSLAAKMRKRLQILGENAHGTSIRPLQEIVVLVGQRRTRRGWDWLIAHEVGWSSVCGDSGSPDFFFSSRTVRSISGSFLNAVMARSHSTASKAGEPETRDLAGTSPPMPLCAY